MFWASVYYLGTTLLLFVVFAALVARTYRKGEKERIEGPKYRMLDED